MSLLLESFTVKSAAPTWEPPKKKKGVFPNMKAWEPKRTSLPMVLTKDVKNLSKPDMTTTPTKGRIKKMAALPCLMLGKGRGEAAKDEVFGKDDVISECKDPGIKKPHTRYDVHRDGKNIAYLIVGKMNEKDEAQGIRGFYVANKFRNQGVGKKLMRHALEKNKGKRVELKPEPYEEDGRRKVRMTPDELSGIYRGMGFETSKKDPKLMERTASFVDNFHKAIS